MRFLKPASHHYTTAVVQSSKHAQLLQQGRLYSIRVCKPMCNSSCATTAVQQRWWLSLLVTCSESVMNACRCVASTQMICLHHLTRIDHLHVGNSHNIAVLRASGSGIEVGQGSLQPSGQYSIKGAFNLAFFDSTKSARNYKVPDLPMLLIGGLQGAAALSQLIGFMGHIFCDAH